MTLYVKVNIPENVKVYSAPAVTVQNELIVVVQEIVKAFPVAADRSVVVADAIVKPCANFKAPVIVSPAFASFVSTSSCISSIASAVTARETVSPELKAKAVVVCVTAE